MKLFGRYGLRKCQFKQKRNEGYYLLEILLKK